MTDRVSFITADFFTDDLPAADLYSLGRIIHDWDEPKILKLLTEDIRCPACGWRIVGG